MFHIPSSCFEARWSQALLVCLFVLGLASPATGTDPEGGTVHRLDTAQAEVMLDFLEQASKGPVEDKAVAEIGGPAP